MITIRPGILVSLKTSVSGGVVYERKDIEPEHSFGGDGKRSKWETTRTVQDADEFETACKTRIAAGDRIRNACMKTGFGLVCPQAKIAALDEAVATSRREVDAFNASSRISKISLGVMRGQIASSDSEAVLAISQEVRTLLDQINGGVAKLDVSAIREASSAARKMEQMLDEQQAGIVSAAVVAARAAAREIVRRVERDGEDAAVVLQSLKIDAIDTARFAFIEHEPAPITPTKEKSDAVRQSKRSRSKGQKKAG